MSKRKHYENKAWFCYNGIGDPYNAASYRQVNCKPSGAVGGNISTIYATGFFTPISPLSINIQTYITMALTTGFSHPPVFRKRDKCFVYLKA